METREQAKDREVLVGTYSSLKDRTAFDRYVKQHVEMFLSLARKAGCRSWDDAQDVVQQVLLEAWKSTQNDGEDKHKDALKDICQRIKYRVIDQIRIQNIHRRRSAEVTENMASDDPPVEVEIAAHQKRKDLEQEIELLDPTNRFVIQALIQGISGVEVAKTLGVSKERASQRKTTSCNRLRMKLQERGWACDEPLGMML